MSDAFEKRVEAAKSAPILLVAGDTGFRLVRRGSYYTFAEHDSVVIDARRNCFWHNSQKVQGDAIKMLMHFNGLDFKQAVNRVNELLGNTSEETVQLYSKEKGKKRSSEFKLPKIATDMNGEIYTKDVEKFLTETRCISPTVVKWFLKTGRLYQQSIKEKNFTRGTFRSCCLFFSNASGKTEGRATFCERRTIRPAKGKKKTLTVEGSDWKHGYYINNNRRILVLTEGIPDAMAIMSLIEQNGYDFTCYDYLCIIGASNSDTSLKTILSEQPHIQGVIIALDNDDAGEIATMAVENMLKKEYPNIRYTRKISEGYKDFNDLLIGRKTKEKEEA